MIEIFESPSLTINEKEQALKFFKKYLFQGNHAEVKKE